MLRFIALAVALATPALAAPARIVSLNPCLDALLIAVADRSQIAAVSHYARDPFASSVAQAAATLPITYETAEEVIALAPDLVVTSRHSALATRNALSRLHIQTELFDVPETIAASKAQVSQMAALVGHPERGTDLIARIDAALEAARPPAGTAPVPAVLLEPNGFTVGADTLTDDLFRHTGFTNAAARYGIGKAGNIALEKLIADPPSVLFTGLVEESRPGWADRIMRHPAVRSVGSRIMRAEYPQRLMYCGGAVLIDAARVLAEARKRAEGAAP